MTAEETRYREDGVSWWALVWSVVFAALGYVAELTTGGPVHTVAWVVVAAGLMVITVPWIYARRRFLSVRVTGTTLWQGRESLELARVAEVDDVGAPAGARVLGGGWTVPRKYAEVPLKLDDDTVVLAWARDADGLRSALRRPEAP
ncbi:DUF3093 family protein [Amycolatopsis sp. CA-230715]|uniref:DUF3093 family protein n=1 Tax=Amycolatopsis sp. CA-230715 TaxID=2745196 RepID=UPI001C0169D0|nr:DUF3093 family protein [Amycolatopsis sp. CA-230715]QWF79889.1 hypothetical protein HUW46_03302 [Amycolatopsis sp. CA-230715]